METENPSFQFAAAFSWLMSHPAHETDTHRASTDRSLIPVPHALLLPRQAFVGIWGENRSLSVAQRTSMGYGCSCPVPHLPARIPRSEANHFFDCSITKHSNTSWCVMIHDENGHHSKTAFQRYSRGGGGEGSDLSKVDNRR